MSREAKGPAKTGGSGGKWVVLETPKPPKVEDFRLYWTYNPPRLSERCQYWLRQIDRGWRSNKHIEAGDSEDRAEWYGIYIWELHNVITPMLRLYTILDEKFGRDRRSSFEP